MTRSQTVMNVLQEMSPVSHFEEVRYPNYLLSLEEPKDTNRVKNEEPRGITLQCDGVYFDEWKEHDG